MLIRCNTSAQMSAAVARVLSAARTPPMDMDPQAAETFAFYALLNALDAALYAMKVDDPANHDICREIAVHTLDRAEAVMPVEALRRVS